MIYKLDRLAEWARAIGTNNNESEKKEEEEANMHVQALHDFCYLLWCNSQWPAIIIYFSNCYNALVNGNYTC